MAIGNSPRQRGWFGAALLLAFAVSAVAPAVAFAQMGGGASQPPRPPSETSGNSDQQTIQNQADQEFVKNAMTNDQSQIRLSQMAQQKTSSDDVKQFSQQMVKIHTELYAQMKPAASMLSVDEPRGPSKKEKKEDEQLQGLSGDQFDAAYLQAIARQQQQSLKLFRDEVKSTQNQGLLQAAKDDTPVLEQNFTVLQQVAQAHNVDIGDKK